MDIEALREEFILDPTGLGYAAATNQGKLDLINQPRGAYLFPVMVAKGPFFQAIIAAPSRIVSLTDPKKQALYDLHLRMIESISEIDVLSPQIQGMLALALADGVLVQDEVDTLNDMAVRLGSRAEKLFGEGTRVTMNDLALTL